MRFIVTEKGQELRKELFFDNLNKQSAIEEDQFHESFTQKQGSARKNQKTQRGTGGGGSNSLRQGTTPRIQEINIDIGYSPGRTLHRGGPSYQSLPSHGQQQVPEMVEMQVHVPKIRISKYFKTKYQGAYISPAQQKELSKDNSNSKKGLNLAQTEKLLDRSQLSRIQYQKIQAQQQQLDTGVTQTLPQIGSMKQLHLPKKIVPELTIDQHEPVLIKTHSALFKNNLKMWGSQTSINFSRQNLKSPSYNNQIHKYPFGYLNTIRGQKLPQANAFMQTMNQQFTQGQTLQNYNFRSGRVSSVGLLKTVDFNKSQEFNTEDEQQEQERIRKEKVKWKHMKDEEQRQKLLIKLKEKLEQPEPMPELYDPRRVEDEREMIENAIKRSVQGERSKDKIVKEHEMKYKKFWDRDHAAKLSNIRKYDYIQDFRYKDIHKNPQNILIFNGKMMEFLQKINGNQSTLNTQNGQDTKNFSSKNDL